MGTLSYHALFCSKQNFSVFTPVNINSLNTNTVTKWWKTTTFKWVYAVLYLTANLWCVWIIEIRHFTLIKELHLAYIIQNVKRFSPKIQWRSVRHSLGWTPLNPPHYISHTHLRILYVKHRHRRTETKWRQF